MSVETSDQPTEVKEKTETFPDNGGITGAGLNLLNTFTGEGWGGGDDGSDKDDDTNVNLGTPRPRRRSPSVFHRVAATLTVTSLLLSACAPLQASSSPSYPTEQQGITQPVDTSILPTLSVAQETGAMIAQTTEGRAFYNALSTHDVDPSACSPDVLGNLVVQKGLPLGEASDLMTITTDALAATSEPDHLTGIVCNVEEATDGTQTVSFFFNSDTDHTGDGVPDIFIPSQAKVLLPGELIDGVPQVVAPAVGGESPTGALVEAPDWSRAGGEIPAEIRDLMTVEEQSIRYSLAEKNINTDSVLIHPVFRGSGDDFRMGSGVTNVNQTIAFYPQFDDDGALAWRPDLRSSDRPWHWQSVSLPEGVDGKIEVVFDPDSEEPQFVVLTPDGSRMIGWFNNLIRQWLTKDGQELVASPPPPTLTPEPSPTPPPAFENNCHDENRAGAMFEQFIADFPDYKATLNNIDTSKNKFYSYAGADGQLAVLSHARNAVFIGAEKVDLLGKTIAGIQAGSDSYANCAYFLTPDNQNKPLPVFTRVVVNGKEVSYLLLGDPSNAKHVDGSVIESQLTNDARGTIFLVELSVYYSQSHLKKMLQSPDSEARQLFSLLGQGFMAKIDLKELIRLEDKNASLHNLLDIMAQEDLGIPLTRIQPLN